MSQFWRAAFKKPPPWEGCCVEHDKAYWAGGSAQQRLDADKRLYECVRANGHPWWALIMFLAVRVGGDPSYNFSWRWGFGQPKEA
jgi:hypothetical protein